MPRICDNQAPPKCDEEWLYITVLPIGSPNSTNAMDDYAQTPFNTAVSGNVSTNDTDPEGDNQTVVAQTTTVPGSGTLVLNTDGSYTFTPVNGFSGPVDFPYTTCDDGTPVDCSDATLHVLVDPQAPNFNPDFGATQVNVP
ncbi:MAG: cadherin-like domain-containing protein [Sphingobacteriales bacterium]|nr:cadherin-like domain-containing protein [Sphingobacteriales bacterium]